MATFSKQLLSGSTDGARVLIVPTSGTGTTIHTGPTTTTTIDEVWLYAFNNHTANVLLTVQWAGLSAEDQIQFTVPFRSGLYLIAAGLPIKGNATPLVIRAFAGTANVVTIFGYVNRITA